MQIDNSQFDGLPEMYHVLYMRGIEVKAERGEVLSWLVESYFNRTYDRFCSHRQTPPKPYPSDKPLIIQNGNIISVTHPLFSDYAENGCKIYKDVLGQLIFRLIQPVVKGNLPSTAEVTLRELNGETVLHLLSYNPAKRCHTIETLEDVIPLYDVEVAVRMEKAPQRAVLEPQGIAIPVRYEDGYACIMVDRIDGHQMVVLS